MAAAPQFQFDEPGWCRAAAPYASPFCDQRPAGLAIDLLVIHNISLPAGRFGGPHVADLFTGRLDVRADPCFAGLRGLRVSSHFLIRRDGRLLQFVPTDWRAWHAGLSAFEGRERCNDFSIGIELEGCDALPFEAAQYAALARLTAALRTRHDLTAVRGHEHIAPGRKSDPGPCFDWGRYRRLLLETPALAASAGALGFPPGV
ncbi:MAG: 1,6-anhydro-N-acetylmuramyl-L-alanine amidase AmpD [Pseudomonadota bacterium]